ncbi:S49 family peptidase [Deinococcus radiophilus]|uniref:S49 family peptidase n=1 Tax=Deinococcus radiophilus TaxID=32062 RepID=UPI00361CC1EE
MDETYSSVVEDTNAVFLRAVGLGRGVTPAQVTERWASGRCWVGENAVAVGVADALGSLSDAVQLAAGNRVLTRRAADVEIVRTAEAPTQEEPEMNEETLKLLGLKADATPEQVQAAIQKRDAQARADVLAQLGIEDEETPDLKALAAQAADGVQYRQSLVERLRAATITQQGNDEVGQQAAERAAKVWGSAEIGDLRAEVERLEGQRESSLPAGRVAKTATEQVPTKKRPSARAYGRV